MFYFADHSRLWVSRSTTKTMLMITSNVTPRSEAQAHLFTSMWRWVLFTTLYYVARIFHCQLWYRVLSLCYTCIEVRASSSSPRLRLCQICFFCGLHCWASPWRKSHTQSLITHPAYLITWEPKRLCFGTSTNGISKLQIIALF